MHIFLSADLHHQSLNTGNQQHSDLLELETAEIFCDLLNRENIRYTLFFTGRCFVEHPELSIKLAQDKNSSVGGHGWNGFQPELWHRICKKILGSYNGPYWYQSYDVKRTKSIIEHFSGKTVNVWRNHMYMHGPNTESVLSKNAIKLCSDGVKKDQHQPKLHPTGICNYPLNIMPDHEHIYHAERTVEWVEHWQRRYQWSDDFGSESYPIEQWCDLVLAQIDDAVANNHDINMLIHPITMYLADDFKSLKRIIEKIKDIPSRWLEEAVIQ